MQRKGLSLFSDVETTLKAVGLTSARIPEWVKNRPVYMNKRLSRSLGRFVRRSGVEWIEINPKLLLYPEVLREVVGHEIAHLVAGMAAGHGPSWRRACLQIGVPARRFMPLEPDAQLAIVGRRLR